MFTSVKDLEASVFPDMQEKLRDPNWLYEHAILAPRNNAVDKVNLDLLQLLPEVEESFRSIDTVINRDNAVLFPAHFLNSLQPPGIPPHNLILENGAATSHLQSN